LLPGELGYFKEPSLVSTVLGFCVAISVYDPIAKTGGLNHYLLPEEEGNHPGGKFGTYAIKALVKEAMLNGALPSRLVAGVYGGANTKAKELLRQLKIPVRHADVGGPLARRITLNTQTGQVESMKMQPSQEQVALREKPQRKARNKLGVLVVDDSSMVRNIVTRAI